MRRLFLTLIVAFATICGFAQDVEPSNVNFYEVKGKLKNVPNGTVLQLFRFEGERGFFSVTSDLFNPELMRVRVCAPK